MKRLFTLLTPLFSFTQFASAQTVCDSLDIHVGYQAFYDSLIEIRVKNNGQTFFTYPAFIMYNSNGDTVAKEIPNLFGIAQSSVHVLNIYPGKITNPFFAGTLELYTYTFDTLACSFPMNFDLCPDSCENVIISLENMGGAMFTGTANYEIKDSAAQVMKAGIFAITNTGQYDADTACLYPGKYTFHLSQIALSGGGQKYYRITGDSATSHYPFWMYNQTNDTSFSFSFYKRCGTTTSIPVVEKEKEISVTAVDGKLYLSNPSGQQIGHFMLYSLDGKVLSVQNIRTPQHAIDVSHLAAGIYIVRVQQQARSFNKKVFVGK